MSDRTVEAPPGVRPVRDTDADGVIALIGSVYAEYPGCVLDLDGVDRDLVAPATSAHRARVILWVVEDEDGLAATVGAGPLHGTTVELKRLYVAPDRRRQGLGARLVAWVEDHARRVGANDVELWSDTRFEDAHRLYRRLGYAHTGSTRQLHDPSDTTELHFARTLPSA